MGSIFQAVLGAGQGVVCRTQHSYGGRVREDPRKGTSRLSITQRACGYVGGHTGSLAWK